jgi:hypothetical protein
MASTSLDDDEVTEIIYEAADSPAVYANPMWLVLRKFLEARGVDTEIRTRDQWMKLFYEARIVLEAATKDGEQAGQRALEKAAAQGASDRVVGRDPSMQSRRESDVDSGYQSSGSQDQVRCAFL